VQYCDINIQKLWALDGGERWDVCRHAKRSVCWPTIWARL